MNTQDGLANISFDMPKNQSNVIKVIGVGGGGSNAINHMFQQGIKGVDFVICNTDSQALENSGIPNKIQLGVSLTEGLGAGANPEIGEQAALESYEDIVSMLGVNTKMVFITAGMGGGTGTGAAPIIAKMARELNILTVGIVTVPFQFEGRMRNQQAQAGVEKLRSEVDSLIVINNNKLREVYGNLGFKAGFSKADEVLATASRGIAEVITHHYTQNIDLRDAKTVLSNSGTAIMGSANASGAQRAHDAIVKALDSPLLNDNKITGAKNVLLLIVSGKEEITIDEIGEINDHIQSEAGYGANIIMGVGDDESLDDSISVTVIATGFDAEQQDDIVNTETRKIIHSLSEDQKAEQQLSSVNTSAAELPSQKVTPEATIPTQPKVVEAPKEVEEKKPEIIVHDLFEEIEETPIKESLLMPSTEFIKNLDVVDHEEVSGFTEKAMNDDFVIINTQEIINEIEVKDVEVVEPVFEEENEQMTFTFDLTTPESTKAIEVNDEIEIKPVAAAAEVEVKEELEVAPVVVAEVNKEPQVVRYQLEEEPEEVAVAKEEESEITFEKKTVAPLTPETSIDETGDPLDLPISEVLRSRASERRAHMKDFNYKFRSSASNIDDIERQPAYKRAGLDLDKNKDGSVVSRTTLSTDSNDDLQLRRNNSFLHDNVD
ncbi:cell division protein FtsZ [Aquimarina agarilytica]|uniref:cell division protein FtsZ n=1 Tax=Aquimarina agarilytica TaxID=1087449 RepID=UPI000288BAEC|nr:cell division protein FtsZ [Aquimarina agarilytica]